MNRTKETPLYRSRALMLADHPGYFCLAVLLVPVGVGVLWLLVWWLINRITVLTVYPTHVTYRRRAVMRTNVDIDRRALTSFRVRQTLVERFLNTGTVEIFSEGSQPKIEQGGLPGPERLRAALRAMTGERAGS